MNHSTPLNIALKFHAGFADCNECMQHYTNKLSVLHLWPLRLQQKAHNYCMVCWLKCMHMVHICYVLNVLTNGMRISHNTSSYEW